MNHYIEEKGKIHFNKFILLALLMLVDCYLFNNNGFTVGRFFSILIVLITVFIPAEECFFVVAFCLPFAGVLKFGATSISVMPILYLVVILKLLIQNKIKFKVSTITALLLLFILQLLDVALFGASFVSIASFFLSVIFVYTLGEVFIQKDWDNGYLFKNMTLFFVGAVCLETIFANLFKGIAYFLAYDKQIALDASKRFAALNSDPNEYSQLVLIAFGLLIAYFSLCKNKLTKMLVAVVGAFLIYNGFFTYSKSYALALAGIFVFLLVLFFIKFAKRNGAKSILFLIPIIIAVVLGLVVIYFYVIQPIFDQRSGDDLLTGRGDIWRGYISQFLSNFFVMAIGTGASNVTMLVREINIELVPHNMYIEYIVQFGILGLVSLAVFLKNVLNGIKNCFNSYLMIVVLAFLITAIGISANANDTIFFVLLLLCVPYKCE